LTITIRQGAPSDAPTLALLGRITFRETFGDLFRDHPSDLRAYLDATFATAKIAQSLDKPVNRYWLAGVDGLPVGYAKLKHPSPPPGQPHVDAAQLQKIYVLQDFVAHRIGLALMRAVLAATEDRAPLLWLGVLRENGRAIGFYRRNGFSAIGDDTYAIGAQRFHFHLMARSEPATPMAGEGSATLTAEERSPPLTVRDGSAAAMAGAMPAAKLAGGLS
jgi:ribosomal protein S18 acetylase RimI-like enzyme